MSVNSIDNISIENVFNYIQRNVDAIIVADGNENTYRTLVKRGFFNDFLDDTGEYHDLVEKLWYHFSNNDEKIIEDYRVFIPTAGQFKCKYSKKLTMHSNGDTHVVQMTIYPINDENKYILMLNELEDKEAPEDFMNSKRVKSIQSAYLFSMYIDIVRDTTSSICISELSDDTMNSQITYSQWREQIVNMIGAEHQQMFTEKTDPEYLKKNFAPGSTASFDCLMMNLEGKYIWVKLIFSRAATNNSDDYRFVFMVQDINDSTIKLLSSLKEYEEKALTDPLTGIFNRRSIETEIENALKNYREKNIKASIMIIDIDFFKRVNDEYGHGVGDTTLKHFARIVSDFANTRNSIPGRWGGEEFVVVCYDVGQDQMTEIAEELRVLVEGSTFSDINKITCSIGTTTLKTNDTYNTAFDRMDKALYDAKSSGRNLVRSLN